MTAEKTTPSDDLELIKTALREIIINQSQGATPHERIEAIIQLAALIGK
jgi:hypothetical protein